MKPIRMILAVFALAAAASPTWPAELELPAASNVPNIEELEKPGEVAGNPEWTADDIGMEIDTYLAEDRGFQVLEMFIRQDPTAPDYVLVRDGLLGQILPALAESNPIGLSFVPVDLTGDGLDEMVVQITCPSTCADTEGCRTIVFSFDDEKTWRILLDVRTQEVAVKRGWDEQPSRIATISEKDGVRFHRYEDGRFVSYENVRRSHDEIRRASMSPPPVPKP
ncbi:hypothetical protein BHAOGJBA_5129 [Methylobacterium hispanicum]|uniref:Uncharacterized protein n=1 Tax=Methylobacterium hispanicum TaxID=270350 RepID=A0AAV4ZSL0_9HYPH|nr:hypothetical protein [Methylobacterium hispanicum]GJD91581.1 hypothetical protein BHAOGJBA_5129 [Methylobacterium hispanicum]